MPVNPTYPGLYIEELPSSAHTIIPAPTSITVFVGYAHPFQGLCADPAKPLWGQAIQIFSFADYERYFGGLFRSPFLSSDLPDSVYQFFLNGGSNAYVVAIEPRFHVGGATPAIQPKSDVLAGIKFTSKQLTDDERKLSITIRNIRPSPTNNIADIIITYGATVEQFRGVKTLAGAPSTITDADFIAKRLAGSTLVSVEPAATTGYLATYGATATPTDTLTKDLGNMAQPGPVYDAADFLPVFDNDKPLDKVEIFNLLSIPGVTDNGVWSTALAYCERKLAFLIMDSPINASADGTSPGYTKIQDLIDTIPHASSNGAFYFPYLKTVDPITSKIRQQPPSGYVAGIYARTDMKRGVWKAPAGLEASVLNTTGVVESGRMTDQRQGTVNDKGINVLRSFPGTGTVVWGARTVAATNIALQQWWYVPVRRTALFIEQTLMRNLGWVVFEPNDEPLWTAIRISVSNFMLSLFRQGAFQGRTPSEAFQVLCDKTTTTDEDINAGKVNIVVGFRPLKPAEFVIIKIAQLAGQVQA